MLYPEPEPPYLLSHFQFRIDGAARIATQLAAAAGLPYWGPSEEDAAAMART